MIVATTGLSSERNVARWAPSSSIPRNQMA